MYPFYEEASNIKTEEFMMECRNKIELGFQQIFVFVQTIQVTDDR